MIYLFFIKVNSKIINPPPKIKDIQFSYGGGAVKWKDVQILTLGNEGAYADELRYRIKR